MFSFPWQHSFFIEPFCEMSLGGKSKREKAMCAFWPIATYPQLSTLIVFLLLFSNLPYLDKYVLQFLFKNTASPASTEWSTIFPLGSKRQQGKEDIAGFCPTFGIFTRPMLLQHQWLQKTTFHVWSTIFPTGSQQDMNERIDINKNLSHFCPFFSYY